MNTKNYETKRFLLKPISLQDAVFILELYNTPDFIRFVGNRNIKNTSDAKLYIENRFLPQIKKLGFGNYLISEKKSQTKIGAVGIFEREGLDVADIGFGLLPQFYKTGAGLEAASKILRAGFQDFGLNKISAITVQQNHASIKLIEKLGLTFKKTVKIPDDPEDLLYYEITKDEWEKRNT